jgi:hypothetical protein
MRRLSSRRLIRRIIAVLWVLSCVWLLARTLLLRNAADNVFLDAEYLEQLLMFNLSSPLSWIGVLFAHLCSFAWWHYPRNDARTILLIWLYFFSMGCLQWFVLIPWGVHKAFDLYDFLADGVRRRFADRN